MEFVGTASVVASTGKVVNVGTNFLTVRVYTA